MFNRPVLKIDTRYPVDNTNDPRLAADPRYTDPRFADPRLIDPRYGDPRFGDPRYMDPRVSDPRLVDPRFADPRYPMNRVEPFPYLAQSPLSARNYPENRERHSIKNELQMLKDHGTYSYKQGIDTLMSRISPTKLDPIYDQRQKMYDSLLLLEGDKHNSYRQKLDENIAANSSRESSEYRRGSLQPHLNHHVYLKEQPYKGETSYSPRSSSPNQSVDAKKIASIRLKAVKPVKSLISRAGYRRKTFGTSKQHVLSHIIVKPDLKEVKGKFAFAICQGHGPHGAVLAEAVKKDYIKLLESNVPLDQKSKSILPALERIDSFIIAHLKSINIEVNFSAVSIVTVLALGKKLFVASTGTCGGAIGKVTNKRVAVNLCPRHTCDSEQEVSRVQEKGGSVQVSDSGLKVVTDGRGYNYEVTRAIGYLTGRTIGVISVPEVLIVPVTSDDKFVILASSGVWDLITCEEAVEICIDGFIAQKTEMCCDALIEECEKRLASSSKKLVDISVLVFFINPI